MRSLNVLVIFALVLSASAFRKQKLHVKGQLMCGNKPANKVNVQLYDDDTGIDPDDKLDSGYTDSQGKFNLQGSTRELTDIDGELRIYHSCNDHGKPCDREWVLEIPKKMINSNKVYDFGTMNLEMKLEEEDRDCWN